MSVQFAKRWFNVDEYYRMAEAGILSESDRVELIEGEVIEMNAIGSRHAACVNRLNMLFSRLTGQAAIVSVQNPIRLNDYSEPEPDLVLLRPRDDFYAEEHPRPSDILLVVEVGDSSVEYDKDVKLPLYAEAEIPEVWIVDLSKKVIEIYTQPTNGEYQISRQAKGGESVTSQAVSDLSLDVDFIFGRTL